VSQANELKIAELLRKAGNANTPFAEQREFVRQAEELKTQSVLEARQTSEWNASEAVIRDTLVPGATHELQRVTASTDWIMELDTTANLSDASNKMVAEASLWYGRVSDEVKSYGDEYSEQARNLARRLAGQYGDQADAAEQVFLDEATRLRTMAVRTGIIVEATDGDLTDPEESATMDNDGISATSASTLPEVGQNGYPTETFSNLGENGNLSPEQTSSNRAPAFQELDGPSSQDVVPVNDPGLGQTDDQTAGNNNPNGPRDAAAKDSNSGKFPVSGKKESSMTQHTTCPTCSGHGKVAVRAAVKKEAYSGLPEIDQIANPNDTPGTTPYPAEVAFPWTLNPNGDIPGAIQQAEQQISERNKKSPLVQNNQMPGSRAAAYTAGGRDNSGWIGDQGGKGLDYPGEQIGQYPLADTSVGYADPVYGHGGDNGNQPNKPFGLEEENDFTNKPAQWAPGQPTQADTGTREASWRQAVMQDANLAAAAQFIEQRRQAFLRNGR
jgi:hypothetical protein